METKSMGPRWHTTKGKVGKPPRPTHLAKGGFLASFPKASETRRIGISFSPQLRASQAR